MNAKSLRLFFALCNHQQYADGTRVTHAVHFYRSRIFYYPPYVLTANSIPVGGTRAVPNIYTVDAGAKDRELAAKKDLIRIAFERD